MGAGPEQFVLSPSQGVQLMCLAELLKVGDLSFRGGESEDAQSAANLIADVAQEIALQVVVGDTSTTNHTKSNEGVSP